MNTSEIIDAIQELFPGIPESSNVWHYLESAVNATTLRQFLHELGNAGVAADDAIEMLDGGLRS